MHWGVRALRSSGLPSRPRVAQLLDGRRQVERL